MNLQFLLMNKNEHEMLEGQSQVADQDSSWSISAHGRVTILLKICIEGGGDEVSSKDEVIQISSTDFVQTMASMDESTRQIIMKESGIRALGHVLDPKSSSLYKSREMTLRRIVN
ncbi:hypothetical protein FXO37_12625 [Capsicum annuum]|nr:hypothetical protein FXO37_12625 [Capsicum annuum]